MKGPRLDPQKIFDLLTEAEAAKFKKLIKEKKAGAVRAMAVAALRRADHLPLSHFVAKKRERIVG